MKYFSNYTRWRLTILQIQELKNPAYTANVNKVTLLNSTKHPRIILRQILSRISFHSRFVEFDSAEGMRTKLA